MARRVVRRRRLLLHRNLFPGNGVEWFFHGHLLLLLQLLLHNPGPDRVVLAVHVFRAHDVPGHVLVPEPEHLMWRGAALHAALLRHLPLLVHHPPQVVQEGRRRRGSAHRRLLLAAAPVQALRLRHGLPPHRAAVAGDELDVVVERDPPAAGRDARVSASALQGRGKRRWSRTDVPDGRDVVVASSVRRIALWLLLLLLL